MIGERLGAFTIRDELGTGGMGTVYLAEAPEETGGQRRVAIKVIHSHLIGTAGYFKRFLREASLGRQVRHANVVGTLDIDATEVDGRIVHYLVMEYVEGRSLRRLLSDLGRVPESLLREIALQTAAGLAAIHACDVVHRDLKPENILITEAHEVRIMDLGVAKLEEASIAITRAGQFAGSVLYAAPEQFGPATVGASADLYSLGVVLHELATGEHPFRADSVESVIDAHLHRQPPSVNDLAPETTRFFSEVIATLLAKEPEDRFESAEQLRAVLEDGESSAWWETREQRILERRARRPEIAVRRETRLHGRAPELAQLEEAWSRALAGEGSAVFIEGEAGIGKTRLVDAFLRTLDGDRIHLFYGSYAPSGGRGGISEAILTKFGSARLARALRPYLVDTASLAPAFAAVLKHESTVKGAPRLDRDALHAVCGELIRTVAADKPVLWVVDDLHFAEPESRLLVLTLARAAEGHRALLVATARPGLAGDEMAHFSRLTGFRRILPGRLSPREVIELLRDAFKSEALAERLGGKIAYKSDGIPFFVFEMIRGLRETRLLEQRPDGSYVETEAVEEIAVPSAVRDLVEGRLLDLGKQERDLLDVGAVQGFEFEADLCARVLGRRRVAVLQDLAAIERRQGIVRSGGGSTRFDHHQIQEVIYDDLIPELRSEYHSLLADAFLEREDAVPTGAGARFVAEHYLRGNRPQQGLPYLDEALDHLEGNYRSESALDLIGRALELEEEIPPARRAELLLRRAGRFDLLGQREEQRQALDAALGLAVELDDDGIATRGRLALGQHHYLTANFKDALAVFREARRLAETGADRKLESHAIRALAQTELALGRPEDARELLESALDLARGLDDPEEEAAIEGGLGTVFNAVNRVEEARFHLTRARDLARELGAKSIEMAAVGNLGNLALWEGRFDDARELLECALRMAREIGDRKRETSATLNIGVMYYSQGLYDEAERCYALHGALARRIGDRRGEALAAGNLGGLFSALGRYAESRSHLQRQIELAREIGDRESEGLALVCLGSLHSSMGDWEGAEDHLGKALKLCREIGYRYGEGYALGGLAIVAEVRRDHLEARRLIDETLRIRVGTGQRQGEVEALLQLGQHLVDSGDREAAREPLERARDLAFEVGAPAIAVTAACWLALLPEGDARAARALLEEHVDRVGCSGEMEARFLLWQVAGDPRDLERAHELLRFLHEQTPPEHQQTLMTEVGLHRDIHDSWESESRR